MKTIYRIAIGAYALIIRIATLFSEKARQWRKGRKKLFHHLKAERDRLEGSKSGWIWIHSSSLGEFEQVRPVMEVLRDKHPDHGICLTFFSPSGFEARKDKDDADIVTYMPLDQRTQAQRFLSILDPQLAIFVKYELWYEHLEILKERAIPSFLIAAVFRKGHRYFRWYGGFFRKMLKSFEQIHVQEERSQELLEKNGIEGSIVSGDPRYDRVSRIAEESEPLSTVEQFKGDHSLLIGGSTWPQEEKLLSELMKKVEADWKILLAPHDVSERHVRAIERLFPDQKTLRYSDDPGEEDLQEARILIVDRIGLLSRIYKHGEAALIGGGFSGALHNVLEPAAHGLPVCFGPDVTDFPEAVDLIVHDAAFAIGDHRDLQERVDQWSKDPQTLEQMGKQAHRFVEARKGASDRIMKELDPYLQGEELSS